MNSLLLNKNLVFQPRAKYYLSPLCVASVHGTTGAMVLELLFGNLCFWRFRFGKDGNVWKEVMQVVVFCKSTDLVFHRPYVSKDIDGH